MTRWHSPPAELYAVVEHTPATVLLESANPHLTPGQPDSGGSATRTRLFTAPLRVCVANHPSELPNLFAEIEHSVDAGLYAAGYFAYECGAFFEPTASPSFDLSGQPPAQPLAWFGIYREPRIFDHHAGAFLGGDPPALAEFRATTMQGAPGFESETWEANEPEFPLECNLPLDEENYASHIHQVHQFIRSGDIYQLNFTIPIQVRASGSSAALYRRLRSRQPAPYGAFLHTEPGRRILSFSPELFFRIETEHPHKRTAPIRRITTRPMKGTAPRGRTNAEDREQADWLRNDPKNRSENVMIVDLLRNDLGRLCSFGSVQSSSLFAVERYPTLWQMTSTVTGQLRPEIGFQEIFRALFPCGSVTGAPKIRAMQLIAQLEQRPRGVYTGAIGFFSKSESVFNVAIRTLSLDGDTGTMGVGSGIVIDSDPAAEFRECLLKAEFLTRVSDPASQPAMGSFSLVETLLWQGEYPLIELHLDRLEDSAHYFAFPFNRAGAKAALQAHAKSLTSYPRGAGANSPPRSESPRKVRLLLNSEGHLHITDEPIPAPAAQPLRVRIATQRTDPCDPMYFHKTTQRLLYAETHWAATEAGYDDVLFLNIHDQVTEGAIHNVFVEKDGRLFTPPIDCGLLPGVERRNILATHPEAEEKVLTIEDLRQADAIHLCNAVRGIRQAVIDWQ
jgi:para-aminobenzoate synthetase/4-amino-4-deoxychorismate lyase